MKKNKTNIIGTIVTIVILILVVILSNLGNTETKGIQNVASRIFTPLQSGFVSLKNKMSGKSQLNSDIDELKSLNQNLTTENSELKEQLREYEILKSDNEKLKEYLNLTEKYSSYTSVPAYVVEKSISNYDKIFVINVGSNDGVEIDMPVISDEGLVGHIISVTETTSKVQTIIDTASTVSCSLSTSDETILLKGQLGENNTLKATYIPTDATILQGDSLYTSGLGGVYPKGILVGTVEEVVNTKNESDRYAKIKTSENFNKLETVLVLISINK